MSPEHDRSVTWDVFAVLDTAWRQRVLVHRESSRDKEFHFQNWVQDRLTELGRNFEQGGRNSYPDFRFVQTAEGIEVKGLAYPGRDASFDSNSQPPSGYHNGRVIYYVFGRYPKDPDGPEYPVEDLVVCHGDLLNADHEYEHRNRSLRLFGSYGDIMIRDRKMYVAPTPFALLEGVAHSSTLIMPAEEEPPDGFAAVGEIVRVEASKRLVGYSFDLETNAIEPRLLTNPTGGREHRFTAYRTAGTDPQPVRLRQAVSTILTGPLVLDEEPTEEEDNGE